MRVPQRLPLRRHAILSNGFSTAALTYANAEADLAKTRNTMIDRLNQQIDAERAGLRTTSNRLVDEYNRLVTVHNQQVDRANTALSNLKKLL
jgi:exonuclease VII large subunit